MQVSHTPLVILDFSLSIPTPIGSEVSREGERREMREEDANISINPNTNPNPKHEMVKTYLYNQWSIGAFA